MAEFFEMQVRREDGSSSLQYINIEAISYVDLEADAAEEDSTGMRVYLNNGYWFTVAGPKAAEVLRLIKERKTVSFGQRVPDQ